MKGLIDMVKYEGECQVFSKVVERKSCCEP